MSESGVKNDQFDTESTNEEAKATYLNELIRAQLNDSKNSSADSDLTVKSKNKSISYETMDLKKFLSSKPDV